MADIHVSFDIETLHTRPDGVILSIAAAARVNGEVVSFYSHCNLESQAERAFSQDTLDWWAAKGDLWHQTRAACEVAPALADVLRDLNKWYASLGNDRDSLYPWGNGASFDIAFLEHAFSQCDMKPAWAFWMIRDLRTAKHIAQAVGGCKPVERVGTHHDARDDAITQLLMAESYLEAITSASDQRQRA